MMATPAPSSADSGAARTARATGLPAMHGRHAGKADALPFALPEPTQGLEEQAAPATDGADTNDEATALALALLLPTETGTPTAPAIAPIAAPIVPSADTMPAIADAATVSTDEADAEADLLAHTGKAMPAVVGRSSDPGSAMAAATTADSKAPPTPAADTGPAQPMAATAANGDAGRPTGPASQVAQATPANPAAKAPESNAGGGADSPADREKRNGNASIAAPAATERRDSSAQLPPFRLEPQAETAAAAPGRSLAPASAASQPAPPAEAADPAQTPDILVETSPGRGLDVTLAAHSTESLRRIEQARHELAHALSELGTDVEAIRVELASDRRPDNGASGGGPADRGERQGEQTMSQTGSHRDGRDGQPRDFLSTTSERQGRVRLSVATGGQGEGAPSPGRAASGRIDLYA